MKETNVQLLDLVDCSHSWSVPIPLEELLKLEREQNRECTRQQADYDQCLWKEKDLNTGIHYCRGTYEVRKLD